MDGYKSMESKGDSGAAPAAWSWLLEHANYKGPVVHNAPRRERYLWMSSIVRLHKTVFRILNAWQLRPSLIWGFGGLEVR